MKEMTELEAVKRRKFFGAAVIAQIWCYEGEGQWSIGVARSPNLVFFTLDQLKRAVLTLFEHISEGREDLEMYPASSYSIAPLVFLSVEEAKDCMAELNKAVLYVQSVSNESDWHEVPSNLFERFAVLSTPLS